jgi:RNA polymerase sigma factor (sigma-70 family)
MKDGQRSFIEHIETLFDAGAIGEPTDRQLLERFTGRDRKAAELAFTTLVKRHGPMVFRACRAILHDPHASEDAFQATFLVLSRKATGLWVRGSLGPWLMEVACRVASAARAEAMRRRVHERKAAELSAPAADDASWDDRDAILHEELGRLPEKYRTAVVLCDLEGLTQEQAARQLGWPAGTVRSRLSRGRDQLRGRLSRRGLAPPAVLAGSSPLVEWKLVSPLVETTVQAALRLASGQAATGSSASAIALTEGVLKMMFWTRLRTYAAIVLAGTLLSGAGLVGYRAIGRVQSPAAAAGQQSEGRSGPAGKPAPPTATGTASSELDAIGKARVEVARKLRDTAERLWRSGEKSLVDYLTAMKRYDEVVADVGVKTEADRIRFLERQVVTLKQIEEAVRKQFDIGQVTQTDVLTAELARLDAEYALAMTKAKTSAGTGLR